MEFRGRLTRIQLLGFGQRLSRTVLENSPQVSPWRDGLSGVRTCLRASVGSAEASWDQSASTSRTSEVGHRRAENAVNGRLREDGLAQSTPGDVPVRTRATSTAAGLGLVADLLEGLLGRLEVIALKLDPPVLHRAPRTAGVLEAGR